MGCLPFAAKPHYRIVMKKVEEIKGSARLYISLSNLFSISAYVALTFVVYLVYLWLKINHDLAYVQDVDVIRLNGFLNRIEGVFKYLASIGLGFVAGLCKIFLKEKIGR